MKFRFITLIASTLFISMQAIEARTDTEKSSLNSHLTQYLSTHYSSAVTNVEVTNDKVIISGFCFGTGSFKLIELTPADDVTEDSCYTHRTPIQNKDFTVILDRHCSYSGIGYDRLLSKWAIIDTSTGKDVLVSHAHYADKVAIISSP